MARRTTLTQQTQLGVESTAGTAVAANKRLRSIGIELGPEGNIRTFRPTGNKYPSIAALGKEWASGDASGAGTYTELIYALSGLLGPAAITTPGGGTTSRQHEYIIESAAVQDPQTYTIEKGSSVRAHRSAYGFWNEFGMEFNREEINVSGAIIAQAIEDNVSLTASPTDIELIPILPQHVDVFLDSTWAGIGSTQLIDVVGAGFNIGDRFGTFWPLDSSVSSFADAYEVEPSSEVSLTMEANAAGMAQLTDMRAGDTVYIRIEANGSIIEAAIPYRLTLDLPCKVREVPSFSDEDGIYGVEWTFGLFDDTDAGSAGVIQVVNEIATL